MRNVQNSDTGRFSLEQITREFLAFDQHQVPHRGLRSANDKPQWDTSHPESLGKIYLYTCPAPWISDPAFPNLLHGPPTIPTTKVDTALPQRVRNARFPIKLCYLPGCVGLEMNPHYVQWSQAQASDCLTGIGGSLECITASPTTRSSVSIIHSSFHIEGRKGRGKVCHVRGNSLGESGQHPGT